MAIGSIFGKIITLLLVGLISLPIVIIFTTWFVPSSDLLEFFPVEFLLNLINSSAILLAGVALFTTIIGVSLAFLVVFVDFPLKNFFRSALFLPFAVPSYVMGFIYLGVFDYSGYGQEFMREYLGLNGFDLRSSNLAIIATFSLVFYPYIYMIAKASFMQQNINILHSAKLLGASPLKIFTSVAIPLIRPAIAAGVLITLMETLADFGLVSMFNYNTFTTAIYSAWSDFRSIEVATKMASILMLVAVIFIFLEKKMRGKSKYYSYAKQIKTLYKPNNKYKYLITLFPFAILLIAFILPVLQLILWSIGAENNNYLHLLTNSTILVVVSVISIITITLILIFNTKSKLLQNITRIATLGYSLPGTVIAISLLYIVSFFSGEVLSYILSSSIILLVFAYIIRFIAISYNSIISAKSQIKPVFYHSALTLGISKFKIITQIQIPMLKHSIIAASILIAVDVLKELPATYLLRPFGFDTLAIKIYELSAEGLYEMAALPSLIMVIFAMFLITIAQKINKD